jgi:hypothetical protein
MSKKPITIKSLSTLNKNKNLNTSDILVDKWVNKEEVVVGTINDLPIIEEDKETRLTVLIPTYLHRRIKKHCASHSISMKEKIIQVFKEKFPEN